MRRFCAIAVLASLVLLAGCTGGDRATISEQELPRLVLQPSDLDGPWVQFDQGRQRRADSPPGMRSDPTRFGRLDGWKARFRRSGSPETLGPLVIESRADLFDDTSGAEEDFEAAAADLRSIGSGLDDPELGDEARAVTAGGNTSGSVRYFTVLWRDDNVVAVITANGFYRKLTFEQVLGLATKQQARIERAAES